MVVGQFGKLALLDLFQTLSELLLVLILRGKKLAVARVRALARLTLQRSVAVK